MIELSTSDAAVRLLVAMVCGGLVGWERAKRHKPAGLRTHILVSAGSATFILIVLRYLSEMAAEQQLIVDPTRVLQGILAGVGLIAGGTIIRGRSDVHGLTTAATIWAVTAVGSACGFGHFDVALLLTAVILVTTRILVKLDPKGPPDERHHDH
jgi:putative Mg2+ transporter-C (MgtC) family protein